MIDINAIINDAIAKAVESHIGEINARYAARISELALQVTNLRDEVDCRAKQTSCIEDDVRDVLETMSTDGSLWDLIDDSVRDGIDNYLDPSRGEMRINDAVSEALNDEYLKVRDFGEQLQECLDSEITLKVTVE